MNNEEYRKNLFLTLLVFLTRLADKGKHRPLEQIGLDARQIRRLRQLRVETIQQLPDMIHQAFDFSIDAKALDAAISLTEFPPSDQQIIVKLIQCGSPLWLVRQIYGLERNDYAAVRRHLGIKRSGRPAALTESEENLVRQAWDDHGHLELPRRLLMNRNFNRVSEPIVRQTVRRAGLFSNAYGGQVAHYTYCRKGILYEPSFSLSPGKM